MNLKKILRNLILCFLLFVSFVAIHEIGHATAAYFSECFDFEEFGIDFASGSAYTVVSYKANCDYETFFREYKIIASAGSIFGYFSALAILALSYKKNAEYSFWTSLSYMISECAYWIISPIIERGDGYMLMSVSNFPIALYMWIVVNIMIFTSGIGFKLFTNILDRKWLK